MPDHLVPTLPRIALVFGDEATAAHVREALQAHVDIAYATAAGCFDAARMAQANVDAALVNLDDGGCLDAVEAVLDAADIPVVYNDPEISRGLEGWARARWLRHLLAKLRGSTDVDPPRPGQTGPRVGIPSAALHDSQVPVPHYTGVFERPLSPQEIETMTADFVQESAGVSADDVARPAVAAAPTPTAANAALPDAASEPGEGPGVDNLEVDTETLSAMIDARLADAEFRSPDSPEVWRLVEGGPASTATPVAEAETGSRAAPMDAVGGSAAEAEAPVSLPSLDDWQLVDTDAAPAPAPPRGHTKNPEPALSESLAGLTLEPIEIVTTVVHTEPIERWLHESEPRKSAATARSDAEAEPVGDKA